MTWLEAYDHLKIRFELIRRERIVLGKGLENFVILRYHHPYTIYYHLRFQNILMTNGFSYKYTCPRLQTKTSNVCELYCIHIVSQRMERMKERFPWVTCTCVFNVSKLHVNDQLVWYEEIKHPKTCVFFFATFIHLFSFYSLSNINQFLVICSK